MLASNLTDDIHGYINGISYPVKGGTELVSFSNSYFQIKRSQLYNPHQPINADLSDADLTNANLKGAKVTSAQLA
jgi:uncharacterized protein YjbI with pentapeptide repeats